MPGKRIKDLTALSGAGSANNDDVVIFDADADATKRISRSQLAEGMQGDVQVFANKTINLGSNTLTGTTAQFNTALSDNNFATQAGSEVLTNKTIDSANNTLTVNYKEARVETSDASRTHLFTTVAALLADTGTYTTYAAGQIVEAGGFRYQVAASGASDQHVTTAGGVKLYVLPDEGGYNVKAFGAVGDGVANDTAAVQAAINTGGSVIVFPMGTYRASGLTQSTNSQVFLGVGRVTIYKNANGVLLTASGRDWSAENIIFDGRTGGFTGGCILGTGDAQRLVSCGARSSTGYAVELRGSSVEILGTNDIYFTDDATAGPLKIGDTGSAFSLYNRIVGIKTSTSAGKILIQNAGTTWLIGSQTGNIEVPFGSGASLSGCRVVGNLVLQGSFCQASDTTVSGNLTVGDGVNAISSVVIGGSVMVSGTSTVTINANIRESVIHTAQMTAATIVDNLTGSANDIDNTFYGRPTTYTPVWGGGDGTQSIGNGTLTAQYTRVGRSISVVFNFQANTTTTFGTGATEYTFSLPIKARNSSWTYGPAEVNLTAQYLAVFRVTANDNKFVVLTDNYAGPARYNRPEVWASGMRVRGQINYVTV